LLGYLYGIIFEDKEPLQTMLDFVADVKTRFQFEAKLS
jgi:hypothetical protein